MITLKGLIMSPKRHIPEQIVSRLRRVEGLLRHGMSRIDAILKVSITEQTYYR